jgi:antitoxin component YwqK of YwqJK toxin-antitoxin module
MLKKLFNKNKIFSRWETITIGELGSDYHAELNIESRKLKEARQNPATKDLQGKAFFDALVDKYRADPREEKIKTTDQNGVEIATYRKWHYDGPLHWEAHYKNSKYSDATDGSAAYREWDRDGNLKWETHYLSGSLNDPRSGVAARREFYSDGKVKKELHYRFGNLEDPISGRPAVREWDKSGQLTRAAFYHDNRITKNVTESKRLADIQRKESDRQAGSRFSAPPPLTGNSDPAP